MNNEDITVNKIKKAIALLLIASLAASFPACAGDGDGGGTTEDPVTDGSSVSDTTDAVTEELPVPEDMVLYYDMTLKGGKGAVILDQSGNGHNGKIAGDGAEVKDNELYITGGTYVNVPSEPFIGKETLTISLWLNNYTGTGNYAAMYIGTTEELPTGYWLLNPCNPSGKLKSVITNSVDKGAPFNTEVGISATKGGKAGPATSIGWNYYTVIISDSEMSTYFNGELVGTQKIRRNISDFGENIAVYLGKSSYNDPTYSGFIKELKVFDRALTEDEIKAEYKLGGGGEKVYAESEYKNPFIAERADPYITKADDGYYYFTASYPQRGNSDREGYDRVILRRSNTLEGLSDAEEITIWHEDESDECFRYIWAPELHYIGGAWYVYFAGSTERDNVWAIRCYVLACDSQDPYTGNWTLKGRFQPAKGDTFSFSNTGMSLDMTYFEHDGDHYVIWAQIAGASNLYLAKIDPETPWKLKSKPIELTVPEYYWEKARYHVNEGPAVLITDKHVFVFYSAAGTGPEYCVGLLMADIDAKLMNKKSWTKLPEPLLTSTDLKGEYGPGHNSFTVDENGDWVFVYHARSEECFNGTCGFAGQDPLVDPCRHARLRKVLWTKDGMPILNGIAEE